MRAWLGSAMLLAGAAPWTLSAQGAAAGDEAPLGAGIAATAPGAELTFEELDEALAWRHALDPDGRAALRELLELSVLASLERREGVEVTPQDLRRRWDELDREIRASGAAGGVEEYLAESDVDPDTFRRYLRLSLVQEALTRRTLAIPEGDPVSGEQQTMWLEGVMAEMGYEEQPFPWSEGVVARCGDVTIRREDYLRHLRESLPDETVAELCHQLLLEEKVLARMPDLSPEAVERAVEAEIARRREVVEADPQYQGVPYEQLLSARGLSLDSLRHDPAIRVAALSLAWIDRTVTPAELRAAYEAERELFDGLYGAGVEIALILLRAARFENDLNPRGFETAEAQLAEIAAQVRAPEDFGRLAKLHSEDRDSRERGGKIGLVTRGSEGVPEPIRRAAFEVLDRESGDVLGRVLGPLRIQGGVVLVQLGERRPVPSWEEMSLHVHRELRRRFLDELLQPSQVATWLDAR